MLFSILIPAYKSTFLKECIESILSQSFSDFEIIIVDDDSPERLYDIVSGFSDERIKYYKNKENCGAVNVIHNWNISLDYASGDYVICMGDDDTLMPECLQEYARLISEHPTINVFHCRSFIIDERGERISLTASWPGQESVYDNIWHRINNYREHFIGDFLFKRTALIEKGKFYYLPLAWASDDITTYLLMEGNGVIHINTPLFCYRRSSMTITNSGNASIKLSAIDGEEAWFKRFMHEVHPKDEVDKTLIYSIEKELPHYFKIRRLYTVAYSGYTKGIIRGFFFWLRRKKHTKLSLSELIYAAILATKAKMSH